MPEDQVADTGPILGELEAAWTRTDRLFGWLSPQAQPGRRALLQRPIGLRHPFVFYLGHLPAFAWNHVGRGVLGRATVAEVTGEDRFTGFEELFERGIDPADEDAAATVSVGADAWPPVDDIRAYGDAVRRLVVQTAPALQARAGDDVLAAGARVLHLVLEHELMHHETLLYMIGQHDLGALHPPQDWRTPAGGPAPTGRRLDVPAGPAVLGADFEAVPFGWDNEFPAQRVTVPGFTVDSLPVTVADYAAFVAAGGYDHAAHWRPQDHVWIRAQGRRAPLGWRRVNGEWRVRAPFAEVSLDHAAGWPVQVSCAEARAFAAWRGARLPTEAELHRLAFTAPQGATPRPVCDAAPFDLTQGAPVVVGQGSPTAWGAHEVIGNGWEWTTTPFLPRPGFEAWHRTYPGYSADFFDGEHVVVVGGSWATARRLLRQSFRNWYQQHYPYVFSKFRLVWPP